MAVRLHTEICVVLFLLSYFNIINMQLFWRRLPLRFLAVRSDRLTQGQEPEAPFNTALVDKVTKGSASICDLSEIETREIFPYMNYIIQLIISSSSGSWSRIAGSQQFNIKTCVCLLPQCYWHLLDWPTG